ncbi:hypothetical protein ACVWQG_03515 [Neisseria meningitidis]
MSPPFRTAQTVGIAKKGKKAKTAGFCAIIFRKS